MDAPINDDWTVDLIRRNVHARLWQPQRTPRLGILWSGSPAPGSVNDRPHVYDFGLLVSRVVFPRGTAQFVDQDWTVERYWRRANIHEVLGQTWGPMRIPESIRAKFTGIRVRPLSLRSEGFGAGTHSYTWTMEES